MTVVFDPAVHCGAATHQEGSPPCRLRKGYRTDHVGTGNCSRHGGNTPNGQKHAASERAAAAFQRMGMPIPTDPVKGLAEELARSNGIIQQLAIEYDELMSAGDLLAAAAKRRAFDAERRHFVYVAKSGADLKLDERRTAVIERLADAELLRSLFLGTIEAAVGRVAPPPGFLDRIQPQSARDEFDALFRTMRATAVAAGREFAVEGLRSLAATHGQVH